ncbi:Aux/IAA-ARF-dimerization [Artemisia annua]|uniref:Aux/IAA-ARF-dimerization n=1 Tax=Artemisia annua TaxID=35608 RepID=A0A2U1M257_ARTAN|nr:Aux/IAA-ARF-dimerization [Artemisia annua]
MATPMTNNTVTFYDEYVCIYQQLSRRESQELTTAITILQLFLSSSKPVLRFAAVQGAPALFSFTLAIKDSELALPDIGDTEKMKEFGYIILQYVGQSMIHLGIWGRVGQIMINIRSLAVLLRDPLGNDEHTPVANNMSHTHQSLAVEKGPVPVTPCTFEYSNVAAIPSLDASLLNVHNPIRGTDLKSIWGSKIERCWDSQCSFVCWGTRERHSKCCGSLSLAWSRSPPVVEPNSSKIASVMNVDVYCSCDIEYLLQAHCALVQWNEPISIVRPERVSPWEIETFVAPIPTGLAPSVAVLNSKRPRPPIEILNHDPTGSPVSDVWNSSHDSAKGPRGDTGFLLRIQMEAGWLSSSHYKASQNETEDRLGLSPLSTQSAFSPRVSSLKQTNDSPKSPVEKKQSVNVFTS